MAAVAAHRCHNGRKMNDLTYYFAYGSNVHPARFEKRIGRCSEGVVAFLCGARLTFAKRGLDGSGKCDLDFTGLQSDRVVGVLYQVSSNQEQLLDDWESTTCGYTAISTTVECRGHTVDAFTYKARKEYIDTGLLPFDWYKRFVVLGASYFDFPQDYIRTLHQQPSVPDTDPDREKHNGILVAELEQANKYVHRSGESGGI